MVKIKKDKEEKVMGIASYKMDEINHLKDDITKMFSDFFDKRENLDGEYDFIPPVDVIEKGNEIIIEMEIPGVDRENIQLFFAKGIISIKGIKKSRVSGNNDSFHRIERNYGKLHRNIAIPYLIHEVNIKAEVKKGVLNIILIKKDEQSDKKIKINFED